MAIKLFENISKEIFPLEHLLFYFFRRVLFVFLYAFMMFTVMILTRESGVSESSQVITAIVGALIPFIFDTIYADQHETQRKAMNEATKEKLKHILKANKDENNNIVVELILNINNDEQSQSDDESQNEQNSKFWNKVKKLTDEAGKKIKKYVTEVQDSNQPNNV